MNCGEIYPDGREEFQEEAIAKLTETPLNDLTLLNAGMGIGKSSLMVSIAAKRKADDVVVVFEKCDQLIQQIMIPFANSPHKDKFNLIDGKSRDLPKKIRNSKKITVIFFSNITHANGKLNKTAKILENILKDKNGVIVLIDEIDSQLTGLSGGINAKLDHASGIINEYKNVVKQLVSLNIFDILRKYNAKCIGFSGTMNNMICSKLPSMGYAKDNITIINVYPIKSLYVNLQIIPMNVTDFTQIVEYLKLAERDENNDKKVLIAFADEKAIRTFKHEYYNYFGKNPVSVKITGSNTRERNTDEFKNNLKDAKYVFGINLITTGFDLSTLVENQQFMLGILYRNLSDKISQPLSKNDEHELHMPSAASLMQLIARLREGGIFLIPSQLDDKPLFDRLVDVFNKVRDGRNEYDWVGGTPKAAQEERHHQCLVIALIQNLKDDNRPIVSGILDELKNMSGRDFEEEMNSVKEMPSEFDHEYWTIMIGCLWKTYLVDHDQSLSDEDKVKRKAEIIYNHKNIITGGGMRNERLEHEEENEAVRERAGGICGHCGEEYDNTDIPQKCHIRRHNDGGTACRGNLIMGHPGCDSQCDNDAAIIYKPNKEGVWLKKRVASYKPHVKQLQGISEDNFKARWNWEKARQGKQDLSDEEFEEHLRRNKYIFKLYD
jgi:hypothetical protein